jgi:hypothetical protein
MRTIGKAAAPFNRGRSREFCAKIGLPQSDLIRPGKSWGWAGGGYFARPITLRGPLSPMRASTCRLTGLGPGLTAPASQAQVRLAGSTPRTTKPCSRYPPFWIPKQSKTVIRASHRRERQLGVPAGIPIRLIYGLVAPSTKRSLCQPSGASYSTFSSFGVSSAHEV